MEPRSTVFIVDDDDEARESLRQLAEQAGHEAETYASVADFLEAITPDHPGCLIFDAHIWDMSGGAIMQALAAHDICLPIVMVARCADVSMAVEMMKAGAFDFIEKPLHGPQVLSCIRRACAHERRMRPAHAERRRIQSRLETLSERERQVLWLVCAGMPSSDIAAELGVQSKTVEVYRSHVNKKMNARNVAHLVNMIQHLHGLIPRDGPPAAHTGFPERSSRELEESEAR